MGISDFQHREVKLGQTVLVHLDHEYGGGRVHPAIVTKVWGNVFETVNVRLLVDAPVSPEHLAALPKIDPPVGGFEQNRPEIQGWFFPEF